MFIFGGFVVSEKHPCCKSLQRGNKRHGMKVFLRISHKHKHLKVALVAQTCRVTLALVKWINGLLSAQPAIQTIWGHNKGLHSINKHKPESSDALDTCDKRRWMELCEMTLIFLSSIPHERPLKIQNCLRQRLKETKFSSKPLVV